MFDRIIKVEDIGGGFVQLTIKISDYKVEVIRVPKTAFNAAIVEYNNNTRG